jgi:hypothetical protein
MTIKPGTEMYGIWDETSDGWLADNKSRLIIADGQEDRQNISRHGYNSHTYAVRTFVVPGPGKAGA